MPTATTTCPPRTSARENAAQSARARALPVARPISYSARSRRWAADYEWVTFRNLWGFGAFSHNTATNRRDDETAGLRSRVAPLSPSPPRGAWDAASSGPRFSHKAKATLERRSIFLGRGGGMCSSRELSTARSIIFRWWWFIRREKSDVRKRAANPRLNIHGARGGTPPPARSWVSRDKSRTRLILIS